MLKKFEKDRNAMEKKKKTEQERKEEENEGIVETRSRETGGYREREREGKN